MPKRKKATKRKATGSKHVSKFERNFSGDNWLPTKKLGGKRFFIVSTATTKTKAKKGKELFKKRNPKSNVRVVIANKPKSVKHGLKTSTGANLKRRYAIYHRQKGV